MKKFLTLLLALTLVVSMLALVSCKNNTPDDPVDPDPVDPADPVDPVDPVDPDPVDPVDPDPADPVDPDPVDPDPVDPVDPDPVDPVDPDPVDPDPVDPDPVDPDPVDPDPVDPVDPDPADPVEPEEPEETVTDPIMINTTNEILEGVISHNSNNGTMQYQTARRGVPVDISMMSTLELDVYVSDAAAGDLVFTFEIGSAGIPDQQERSISRMSLNQLADKDIVAGWNHLSIDLSLFKKPAGQDADLTAWNWFRVFNNKTDVGDDTQHTVKFRLPYFSMNGASIVAPVEAVPIPGVVAGDPFEIGPGGITLDPDETVVELS